MFTFPMTPQAEGMIREAASYAIENGDTSVRPDHLLRSLLVGKSCTIVGALLDGFEDVTIDTLTAEQPIWELEGLVPPALGGGDMFKASPDFDAAFRKLMELAGNEAGIERGGEIDLEHLLIAVALEPSNPSGRFLAIRGADFVALRRNLRDCGVESDSRERARRPELAAA